MVYMFQDEQLAIRRRWATIVYEDNMSGRNNAAFRGQIFLFIFT